MAGYLERLKMKKRPPRVLQKLQKGETTPAQGTAKTAKSLFYSKCSKGGGHISEKPQEIPAPSPPGLGPEYDGLWKKAWALADWIDDPDSEIPWQERTKYVPKLLEMSVRIGELEVKPANDKQTVKNLKPIKSVSTITTIEQISGYCPAQCKKTGYCYGQIYFKGKPGKPEYCSKNACGYNYELSQWQEYQPSIKQKITKQEGA